MIFEVPIDHFPASVQQSRPREHKPLRLSTVTIQSKELNAAVAPLSPSVSRKQFNFSAEVQKACPKAKPLKRAFTSPSLPVQHLNLNMVRKASTPSSQASRTNSISDLVAREAINLSTRFLSLTASMQQLNVT